MTLDHYALACAVLSLIAMVFSWITMATGNWKWYVPTVLFSIASLIVAGFIIL